MQLKTLAFPSNQLSPEQEKIRAKCFHNSRTFIPFRKEELDAAIPELFERAVTRFPDRIAVRSKQTELRYDALNKKANRLARAIAAARGPRQEPVALFLKDPVQLVTAHLAVLKSGKFSLALDISAPQSRTTHILDDSHAALIIVDTETGPLARTRLNSERRLIDMDEVSSGMSEDNLGLRIAPDHYCYLRYTSGSTGDAKAAIKTNRHVLHSVMIGTNTYHVCAYDRSVVLNAEGCLGKYAFQALLNGAALCPFFIANKEPLEVAVWLINQEITLFQSFPTAFRHLLSAVPDEHVFPHTRVIHLEGEAVYKRDVELYRKYFGAQCILANSFSSTETGTVCLYLLDKETEFRGTTVPVGYPVGQVAVSLLDEHGNDLGPNQVGEVIVRSRFLPAGYWHRPELSDQKYLAEGTTGEERFYRTGDLGQLAEDGCLQLLGRKDFRLKIRSFRVDTAEVESVLALFPDMTEVSVIADIDSSDATTLIAYFVTCASVAPNTSELREFLAQRLPDYMVPSAFIRLEKLPVSATGKVNRRALPKPGKARPGLGTAYVRPRNRIEEQLVAVWAEVLSIDGIGVLDNLLDLGGHSLALSSIISRVRLKIDSQIPASALFECSTVAAMAARVAEYRAPGLGDKKIAGILEEINPLSDEEALRLLSTGAETNGKNSR